MSSTFTAYIDESGDEGFQFAKGSSRWFVLTAVIMRTTEEPVIVKLVDNVRARLGRKDKHPLHFKKMSHPGRLVFAQEVAKANITWMSVFCDKSRLKNVDTFKRNNRLYFYVGRYLLERVSWYARDAKTRTDSGDGTVHIVFSNRSSMSYADFQSYMQRLRNDPEQYKCSIHWPAVDPASICSFQPRQRMGLQIADCVASACLHACEREKGFLEDRYVRLVMPRVYCDGSARLAYGLKFMPPEAEKAVRKDKSNVTAWIRE